MSKNNIKLICLTFIHCTCKYGKHKKSFPSEIQTNKREGRKRHAHARATSADSIPPRSL